MTQKVVIVEALSTGFNYIQDCLDRGLEPVILEVKYVSESDVRQLDTFRAEKYAHLKTKVLTLREDKSYEKTLAMIRELKPILVIPGSEDGVILATRLADDLKLPGNPYSIIDKMTNKFYMHKALADAGVRHIRGKVCKDLREAEKFYDELDNENVVVKPPHGAGAMGVRFCRGKQDLLKKFSEQLGQIGCLGDVAKELLIQERIIGDEYIVNTLTFNGTHKVTSIWKYEKKALINGSNVYVGAQAIDTVSPEAFVLTQYAFSVLDAIGIKQGPVHGEYMFDEKGPVLMEINCRCMGCSYPPKLGDQVFGHHETDISLDSYLFPEQAMAKLSKPYQTMKHAKMKILITPQSMSLANSPILGIIPYLKSYFSCSIQTSIYANSLDKTVDLETSPGTIFMLHENYSVIQHEYDLLKTLESKYFGLLYQEKFDCTLGHLPTVSAAPKSQGSFEITQRHMKDYPLEDVYDYLKQVIGAVKKGGSVVVSKESYEEFPYGAAGMVMILKIFGLEVELPDYRNDKIIAKL